MVIINEDGTECRIFLDRGVDRGFVNMTGLGRWLEIIIIVVVIRENGKRFLEAIDER